MYLPKILYSNISKLECENISSTQWNKRWNLPLIMKPAHWISDWIYMIPHFFDKNHRFGTFLHTYYFDDWKYKAGYKTDSTGEYCYINLCNEVHEVYLDKVHTLNTTFSFRQWSTYWVGLITFQLHSKFHSTVLAKHFPGDFFWGPDLQVILMSLWCNE